MIQWLQKYSGIKSEVETIEESELENLRREMNHYKKKYLKDKKSNKDIVLELEREIEYNNIYQIKANHDYYNDYTKNMKKTNFSEKNPEIDFTFS